jgi:hypothetical protein
VSFRPSERRAVHPAQFTTLNGNDPATTRAAGAITCASLFTALFRRPWFEQILIVLFAVGGGLQRLQVSKVVRTALAQWSDMVDFPALFTLFAK